MRYGIVVHGGVGSPSAWSDACRKAAGAGAHILKRGGSALDATVAAAVVMENDERFNAGTGSTLRFDGKTIEMDASVMDSEGHIGAVAAIRKVKNPILVAREVTKTPHVMLCGEGATRFARQCGFPSYHKITRNARDNYAMMKKMLKQARLKDYNLRWNRHDPRAIWNFPKNYDNTFNGHDTIGAVALDKNGRLAVAASTGGASPMLLGRVGDTPLIGCGFFAGPKAAVATTGIGEEIIRKTLARTVYDWIASGMSLQKACAKGVALYPPQIVIGVIAITPRGYATANNRDMATHSITS